MELARVLRELSKRPRLLALGAVIAALAAVFSVYHFDGGKLKPKSLQYSSASSQVLVDSNSSVLGNVSQPSEPLAIRAQVYANFMTSPAFLDDVAQQVGLSGSQLYAAGPNKTTEPRVEREPTDLKRNVEITGETKPYRLDFESQQELPTITINTQAPTTAQAVALANAAATGLQHYVASVESAAGLPTNSRVIVRQLGPATGAVVDGGISKTLMVIVFLAVFMLWCVLVLMAGRFREIWREGAATQDLAQADGGEQDWGGPTVQGDGAGGAPQGVPSNGHVYDPESAPLFDSPSKRPQDHRPAAVAARGIR